MINRLGQRLKENFQETTRDISLLAGGTGSSNATYFDATEDKVGEIGKLLEARAESERLEGMKRIIAAMSKGRNMEVFFAQVVKNVVASSVEIRKLVYIYLLRYASTNADLLLLSINTFQKDLSDPSPLIRSMSLRVLTSIRVPVIQAIVLIGLKKLASDRNPWVRKTVAGGIAKVYEMDPSSLPQLLPLLQTLLSSTSPLTLGASLTAFSEICPDYLELLHPYYRHICRLLVDADEWGQAVILNVLTRYSRVMLERPDSSDRAVSSFKSENKGNAPIGSDDEFEGLDIDLAMLLHHAKPLFQSRNAAVVLAMAQMYYHLAPEDHATVGQRLIVEPLLRLAGSCGADHKGLNEISTLAWDVIASMAEERPWLFTGHHSSFFIHSNDPSSVKLVKLKALVSLTTAENATVSIRELKHYVNFPDVIVAEEAVRAIGYSVRTQPSIAETGLKCLMRLLKSTRGALVAQAVIVLKGVILSQVSGGSSSLSNPERLVARLAKQLDNITNAHARASVFWLVGQFAVDQSEDTTMGLKWEGLAAWVPDLLRKAIKGFVAEESPAKLQILTLATKLVVISPTTLRLGLICQYMFNLARYDQDYDVRDRARFLHTLLRGLRDETKGDGDGLEHEEDIGGVILRREQVKIVLLGKRSVGRDQVIETSEFDVGSMSRVTHKQLGGYRPLPEWNDDPTDPSLRETEIEYKHVPTPTPSSLKALIPVAIAVPRTGATPSPMDASPAGSLSHVMKSKFRDLDDFLNSESGSEESEEESDLSDTFIAPVQPPPRNLLIASEYDVDTTAGESDEDEEDNESGTDIDIHRPLYRAR